MAAPRSTATRSSPSSSSPIRSLNALRGSMRMPPPSPGVATRLYAAPLQRPSTDVDLLVMPDELPRAGRVITEKLGLARAPSDGADQEDFHHHVGFHGAKGSVELHFRATSGFGNKAEHE